MVLTVQWSSAGPYDRVSDLALTPWLCAGSICVIGLVHLTSSVIVSCGNLHSLFQKALGTSVWIMSFRHDAGVSSGVR